MLRKKPKSLSEIISGPKSPLGNIAEEARRRTDLGDYLRKHLPAELAQALTHCNFDNDKTLILLASSPEWAARLRFEADRIRDLCEQHGTAIEQVKVRVAKT